MSESSQKSVNAVKNQRIDRRNATKFRLVHRSQEDPLINDAEAPTGVFVPVARQKAGFDKRKVTGKEAVETLDDLKASVGEYVRPNEGEAALYGITFDDSEYDYMQHLKEIGQNDDGYGLGTFIAAPGTDRRVKKDEQLVFKDDDQTSAQQIMADLMPSKEKLKRTYQDQQAIPDSIAGLQPNMDPSLREVLEALEDEAYVEDDEDIFAEIVMDGQLESGEVRIDWGGKDEQQSEIWEEDDEGEDKNAGEWEKEFARFKISQGREQAQSDLSDEEGDESVDDVGSLVSFAARRKPQTKSAASSNYSMSSSAMFRNEGLTLLDDRFDQIEKIYNDMDADGLDDDEDEEGLMGEIDEDEDEDEEAQADRELEEYNANMRAITSAEFEAVMDDFLENYEVVGKRLLRGAPVLDTSAGSGQKIRYTKSRGKANKRNNRGLAQLQEIKQELGRPDSDYIRQRYRLK
ncbi:Low temperature viability protein-domain-containing protein [Lipomyces oligophaga]|uniref:Low temperature viability protein-domain-containing protein n=1 Tax=Lipomyces oligophaga TaxID=45792 RepID=UPI0034CFAD4B